MRSHVHFNHRHIASLFPFDEICSKPLILAIVTYGLTETPQVDSDTDPPVCEGSFKALARQWQNGLGRV